MGEYEQLSKGQSRGAYTRRILEIIANIQKQKEDIGRILGDTRKVRREGGRKGGGERGREGVREGVSEGGSEGGREGVRKEERKGFFLR